MLVVEVDIDGVLEVAAKLLGFFLLQGISCDYCLLQSSQHSYPNTGKFTHSSLSQPYHNHPPPHSPGQEGKKKTCIKKRTFKCLLHINRLLRRRLKIRDASLTLTECHCALLRDHALVLLDINLVSEDHKGERVRVARARLDEKLVAPRVERVERLCVVDVVDEHAAVGAAVEGDAERLEALLAGCVPEL